MKKLILLFIPLLLLAGCSKASNIKPVTKGIEFDTRVCYYNECYEAKGSIDSNGDMRFTITSPENIAGLELLLSGENVTASFGRMEYKNENPQLFGAFGLINKIFIDIREKNGKVLVDDNEYSVEGRADSSEYDLIVSTQGLPIELDADRGDLEMSFLNVKLIK